jgi:hypothetical protein
VSLEALVTLIILASLRFRSMRTRELRSLRDLLGVSPPEFDTALHIIIEQGVIERRTIRGRVFYHLIDRPENTSFSSHHARTLYDCVNQAAIDVTPWLSLGGEEPSR